MSTRLRDALSGRLATTRYEPTGKRIRAALGGAPVLDSTAAVLLWEPRRVVPTFAVPAADVLADLRPGAAVGPVAEDLGLALPAVSDRPVLDPSIPFAAHTADGEPLDVVAGASTAAGAGFRLHDAELAGHVVLDFAAFDWREEDEPLLGHPKDPFHRIDVLRSSRHVRLELDGVVLAESSRPTMLFETLLPARFYLPAEDVRVQLAPSATRTRCAYKGAASYSSVVLPDRTVPDLVWSYPRPEPESAGVRDLLCFFDERVDVVVDGERRPRPRTPWS